VGPLIWAALGGVAVLAGAFGAGVSQMALGLLATAFGLTVFFRHGGRQVTAAGLYSLATAVFVGLAGVYWADALGTAVPPSLRLATAIGFFANVAMHGLFWRRTSTPQRPPPTDAAASGWAIAAGGGVAAVALALHLAGVEVGATLLIETIFGSMALLIVGLLVHPGRRIGVVRLTLVGAVGALYAATVFTGYGRLLLVALGLVAVVPACVRVPGHAVKVLVVALIGPALAVLISAREQFGMATYGAALDGSGSVTQPLADFGRLLAMYDQGTLALGFGSTLVVSALFFVPRALWPDKPLGFGAELTRILEPSLVSIDQSLAAHLGGEWLYDFGYPGLVAMVLVMGWLIARLDGFAAATLARPTTDRRAVLALAAVALLLAGIPDLAWAGTYTYWSRTASRLLVLAVLFVVGGGLTAGRRASRRAGEPAAPR
jgi:hypothetical protein